MKTEVQIYFSFLIDLIAVLCIYDKKNGLLPYF